MSEQGFRYVMNKFLFRKKVFCWWIFLSTRRISNLQINEFCFSEKEDFQQTSCLRGNKQQDLSSHKYLDSSDKLTSLSVFCPQCWINICVNYLRYKREMDVCRCGIWKKIQVVCFGLNRSSKPGPDDPNGTNVVLLHGNQIIEGVQETEQNIESKRSKNQNRKDKKKRGFLKVDGNKNNQ